MVPRPRNREQGYLGVHRHLEQPHQGLVYLVHQRLVKTHNRLVKMPVLLVQSKDKNRIQGTLWNFKCIPYQA